MTVPFMDVSADPRYNEFILALLDALEHQMAKNAAQGCRFAAERLEWIAEQRRQIRVKNLYLRRCVDKRYPQ
jgi:hypothetical protein